VFFLVLPCFSKKNFHQKKENSFLFFGPGMKTVQPIENERKENQPMND
jgi:hypothetical protein